MMNKCDMKKWVKDVAIPKLLNVSSSAKGNDYSFLEGLETFRDVNIDASYSIADEIKIFKVVTDDAEKVLTFSDAGKRAFHECFYRARCDQLKNKLLKLSDKEKNKLWEKVTFRYGEEVMEMAETIDSPVIPIEKFRLSYVLVIESESLLIKKAQKEKDTSWLPFSYFLSQQDLLSIKYNQNIPLEEKELLIDWFTEKPVKYNRKKTQKGITLNHINLMKVALPEIVIIYKAILGVEFIGKIKVRQWQDAALNRFNQSPDEFSYVKREYLQNDILYSNLKSKQKERYFFGKIFQLIFSDKNLTKINKDDIIKELRKTEGWVYN